MAAAVMRDDSLTTAEKIAQVDAILHPKRKRGRPRTETVQIAIRALSMHRKGQGLREVKKKGHKRRLVPTEKMDWRTIAMKLIGCKHVGNTVTRSCVPCGDAIAQAVRRLERTLKEIGELPEKVGLPRTMKELDAEIAKLYRVP
jgi:hypothetical protein